jgi:hypothetical protein
MRWIYVKSSFLFWFGCLWAAIGLALCAAGSVQWLGSGREAVVEAEILEKGRDTDGAGAVRTWLRYVWVDGRGQHVGLMPVDEALWRMVEQGDAVAIERSADGTARVRASGEGPLASLLFCALGLAIVGAGAALSAIIWRRAGRRARVVAIGIAARGVIDAVDRNWRVRINGRSPEFFTFRYKDELGRDHGGRSPDLPRSLEGRWRSGESIRVLYDPLDPDSCEADVYGLRPG